MIRAVHEYTNHLQLILLFSFSVLVALLIPVFASLPSYNSIGAIFLRNANLSLGISPVSAVVIIVSTLISLLFLSFAIVAINVIVKHSRTHTKITKEVVMGLERYTGRVFGLLLLFTVIFTALTVSSYIYGFPIWISYIVVLLLTPFFFYAPSSIVIDETRASNAMKKSANFFVKRFDYFVLWLAVAVVLLTALDFIFIAIGGPMLAGYIALVFDSFFVLPFLITLQSESYIKRFGLLKD
jgi:hypothetical protein